MSQRLRQRGVSGYRLQSVSGTNRDTPDFASDGGAWVAFTSLFSLVAVEQTEDANCGTSKVHQYGARCESFSGALRTWSYE